MLFIIEISTLITSFFPFHQFALILLGSQTLITLLPPYSSNFFLFSFPPFSPFLLLFPPSSLQKVFPSSPETYFHFPICLAFSTAVCEARVVAVALSSVRSISAVRLNLPQDLSKESSRKGVLKALNEIQRRFCGDGQKNIPLLDPVTDMGISSESFQTLITRYFLVLFRDINHYNGFTDLSPV